MLPIKIIFAPVVERVKLSNKPRTLLWKEFSPSPATITEIVHIGPTIMVQRGEANTIQIFVNTMFNYPTMTEAHRVAALNGLLTV